MTAQIHVQLNYQDESYDILQVNGARHPVLSAEDDELLPMEFHDTVASSTAFCTAVHRGYTATYRVLESHLYLVRLVLMDDHGARLSGVLAEALSVDKSILGSAYGLSCRAAFTGDLSIGRGLTVLGLACPSVGDYEIAARLEFDSGALVGVSTVETGYIPIPTADEGEVHCPECGTVFAVPSHLGDAIAECSECQCEFRVQVHEDEKG